MPTLPRKEAEALQVAALITASYVELSQEVRQLLQQGYVKDTEYEEAWKSSDTSSLSNKMICCSCAHRIRLHVFVYLTTTACERR